MRAVVAVDRDYGIGKDGQLLHYVSADLKRFKRITSGGVVIYGRKTLETFPGQKALPGRLNLLLTRNAALSYPNIETIGSLEALDDRLDKLKKEGYIADQFFVIGGSDVYEQLLPKTHEVLITRFAEAYPADRHYPNLAEDEHFCKVDESAWLEEGEIRFRYETWRRVARHVRMEPATKKILRQLARLNPGDALTGSLKDRDAFLRSQERDQTTLYALYEGETPSPFGYLQFTRDALGLDAASVTIQSNLALDAEALSPCLTRLFDLEPSLYSLVVAAEARILLENGFAGEVELMTLPTAHGARRLAIATRPYFASCSVGFYPFPLGLIAMESNGEALTSVDFLLAGQTVKNLRFKMALTIAGYLDRAGKLVGPVEAPFSERARLDAPLGQAFAWLDAYFAGSPSLPALPPLASFEVPPFTNEVLTALQAIPSGDSLTYAELAAKLVGKTRANQYARAVGQACAANPFLLFIPCHRVLGNKGDLVGFSGGVKIKDYLLNHELEMRLRQNS